MLTRIKRKFTTLYYQLLLIERVRFYFCRIRFLFLRKKINFIESSSEGVGDKTVAHNLDGLMNQKAAFGMSGRMGVLLYPLVMLLREVQSPKVLIVGPRTEDDIFFAKALGLRDTIGLDLFSYSKYIDIGDIHATHYPSGHFDAVLLGWMISYSSNPEDVIKECKRIMKPGGFLGIGIESNIEMKRGASLADSPRVNALNTSEDLVKCTKMQPVFVHDPDLPKSYDCGVILKSTGKHDPKLSENDSAIV